MAGIVAEVEGIGLGREALFSFGRRDYRVMSQQHRAKERTHGIKCGDVGIAIVDAWMIIVAYSCIYP